MSESTPSRLRALVDEYIDPATNESLSAQQAVQAVELATGRVQVALQFGFPTGGYAVEIGPGLHRHLQQNGFDLPLDLTIISAITAHAVQRQLKPMAGIKNIVAVASGKGGVGKSTVAANLALAWAQQGARVGVLDADIYGPSQPIMLGLAGQRPTALENKRIRPLAAHGVVTMSIGFLIDPEQPMVWRGPMVTSALTQLLSDTEWGDLDYLVVDMPPGTGDIQLTLAQRVPVAGAVIVTTPQDIALADARKGLKMFEKVNVPVLGVIENMSVHVCSKCGHTEHLFGAGGGERMAAEYGVELLGQLPLDARVRAEADGGAPTVVASPDAPHAKPYFAAARRTAAVLARRSRDRSSLFPSIVVEAT
jgi:ATP-binding protein involved in chromosome partitioning